MIKSLQGKYKKTEILEKNRNQIIELYNDSVKKNGELQTVTNLMQLEKGISEKNELFEKEINKKGKQIIDSIKKLEKTGRNSEKKKKNEEKIKGLIYKIEHFFKHPRFSIIYSLESNKKPDFIHLYIKDLENLTSEILGHISDQTNQFIENYIDFFENLEYLNELKAFNKELLRNSSKGFKSEIEPYTLFGNANQINKAFDGETVSKPGPKFNEDLEDDIRQVLKEIVNDSKFYHDNGKINQRAVFNYCIDNVHNFANRWFNEDAWKNKFTEVTIKTYIKRIHENEFM